MNYSIEAIGIVHSCYSEKFGIPRQPGLVKSARGCIEMLPPCDREEMFKELERFSHIWVQFQFHQAVADGWRPTVRPPWLGGRKRVGLFASRSPHRPNSLGMSVVRHHGLRKEKNGLFLDISGMDLVQGTPVFDIKPYVPYSDIVAEASSGFVQFAEQAVRLRFTPEAEKQCHQYKIETGRDIKTLVQEILAQDPRPASQRGKKREYGMLLWEMNVRWMAEEQMFSVFSIREESV